MMKSITSSSKLAAGALLAALGLLSACTKPSEPVGPAQKAGAAIDQAGDQVGEKLKENIDKAKAVGDNVAEAAKATGDRIEPEAGDKRADRLAGVGAADQRAGDEGAEISRFGASGLDRIEASADRVNLLFVTSEAEQSGCVAPRQAGLNAAGILHAL